MPLPVNCLNSRTATPTAQKIEKKYNKALSLVILFLRSLNKFKSKLNKWMSTKTIQDYSQKPIFKDKVSSKLFIKPEG